MNEKLPKSGQIWRHYKHNPAIENSYTYRIEAIGLCCNDAGESLMVVYRPLYPMPNEEAARGVEVFVRNLDEFMEEVDFNGQKVARFTRIS